MKTKADWKIINAMRLTLVELFPLAFAPKGSPKKPLSVGIDKAIIARAPTLNAAHVKMFLGAYVGGPKYLSALTEGAERIDLDGEVVGTVGAEAARVAAARLAYHRERHPVREVVAA